MTERTLDTEHERRRWVALGVVLLAQLMIIVDASIVNVALPAIQRDLGFGEASLAWVVDAYLICFGGFLLVAGRLGDLAGRRPVLLAGLTLFTVASAACGLSETPAMLVAARAVQGLGAALASAVILAIIATEFPAAHDRARAMSAYMFVSVAGGSLGLLAGGVLTEAVNWHWIFYVNVPIGVVTVVAIRRVVAQRPGLGLDQGVDVLGASLATVAVMLAVYAIVKAPDEGWTSARTLGTGALAIALLGVFGAVEARLRNPILPLRLLRLRSLAGSCVVRGMIMIGMYGCFFIGTLYLERVLGLGTIATGAGFLPMTLVVAAMSLGPTTRLMRRFGPHRLLIAGVALAAAGLVLLTDVRADGSYFPTVPAAFVLIGLGMGSAMSPLLIIAMGDVPAQDAGVASALVNVSMYVASAIGLASLGAIADDHTRALARHGDAALTALVDGYRLAFTVSAATVAIAMLVAIAVLRAPAQGLPVAAPAAAGAD